MWKVNHCQIAVCISTWDTYSSMSIASCMRILLSSLMPPDKVGACDFLFLLSCLQFIWQTSGPQNICMHKQFHQGKEKEVTKKYIKVITGLEQHANIFGKSKSAWQTLGIIVVFEVDRAQIRPSLANDGYLQKFQKRDQIKPFSQLTSHFHVWEIEKSAPVR